MMTKTSPEESREEMRDVARGDRSASQLPAPSGVRSPPDEPDFQPQMTAGRKVARKHSNALRELAK